MYRNISKKAEGCYVQSWGVWLIDPTTKKKTVTSLNENNPLVWNNPHVWWYLWGLCLQWLPHPLINTNTADCCLRQQGQRELTENLDFSAKCHSRTWTVAERKTDPRLWEEASCDTMAFVQSCDFWVCKIFKAWMMKRKNDLENPEEILYWKRIYIGTLCINTPFYDKPPWMFALCSAKLLFVSLYTK